MEESGLKFSRESSISRVILCFLLLFLLLALAAIVILAIVVQGQMDDQSSEPMNGNQKTIDGMFEYEDICKDNTIDVAVIGAGVSGSYAAWKLVQNSDRTVNLYDVNNRAGGRLYSVDIPGIADFVADLGAMRFKKSHTTLMNLIQELGLTVINFTTPNSDDTLYFLRDHLLGKQDITTGNVPYAMTDLERNLSADTGALHSYWNNMIIANSSKSISDVWKKKCVDGKYAYEKGNYNAFLEVASSEAIDYLAYRDLFPGEYYDNSNYAEWSDTSAPSTPSTTPDPHRQMLTVKEGFQQLVKVMNRYFLQRTKSSLFLNHELKSVLFNKDHLAQLLFFDKLNKKYVNVCAKQVILGLPAEAIGHIDFNNIDIASVITSNLHAILKGPAMKTFLAYDRPWWRSEGNGMLFEELRQKSIDLKLIATDKPVGMLLDIGVDSSSSKALLLLYADWWNNVMFWKPYQETGAIHYTNIMTDYKVTESLMHQINLQLSKIFNISMSELPMPYAAVSQSWYEAPYWTAWHVQSGGYNFPEVMKKMIKPVSDKELYIIGEAFSDTQAWTEGALSSAQMVLTQYFGFTFK